MTVDQVIDTLKLEKQQRVPSRFPCRAIMVGNIAEYCDLLEKAENNSQCGSGSFRRAVFLCRCATCL